MLLRARRVLVAAAALVALASLGATCLRTGPKVHIDSPANGLFTTAASVLVTGHVTGNLSQVADVTVNGASALPLVSGSFSGSVTLDSVATVNPIVVELVRTNGSVDRKRVTVMAADSIADGDFSPMGLAMRLDDSGLDSVEPTISSLVDLDLATLLPVGTLVIDNFCVAWFIGCLGRADVLVDNPPPSISGFGIAVNSQTDFVDGDIDVNDMRIDLFVDGVSGIAPDCGLRVSAATTNIDGDYALGADPIDPENVDVNQIGGVTVFFNGFNDEFTWGICDFPLIGDLIQAIIGDLQPTVIDGLEDFLADPDAGGPADSPVADAVETALAGIEIAGPIGQAIGVNLEAPLFDVFEDVNGITLDSDARVTASLPDPEAVNLLASYHLDEVFPSYGPNTPVGNLPYGLGLSISSSAFNQLLKAETESGLLRTSLTEIDLGGGPITLSAGFMALLVPQFGQLPPATLLEIVIEPTMSPLVTGADGPFGELAELVLPHLVARVKTLGSTADPWLEFAIDATIGLDIDFVAGELQFLLGTLDTGFIGVTITGNRVGASEAVLENLVVTVMPILFPSLADSLGTFPLPDFLGLQLSLVEIGKLGEYMSLFVNLTPAP